MVGVHLEEGTKSATKALLAVVQGVRGYSGHRTSSVTLSAYRCKIRNLPLIHYMSEPI